MAKSSVAIDTMQRLVDQVQALSSVAETLTLRLLELEERLQRQERAIAEPVALDLGALAERRLAESEQRLQGLEQMLASMPLVPASVVVALPGPADAQNPDDDSIESGAHHAQAASVDEASEGSDPVVGAPEETEPGVQPSAGEGADPELADEAEGWQVDADWNDLDRLTA